MSDTSEATLMADMTSISTTQTLTVAASSMAPPDIASTAHILALLNEYIWVDDDLDTYPLQNNVTFDPVIPTLLTVSKTIRPADTLWLYYGDQYDWDHLKWDTPLMSSQPCSQPTPTYSMSPPTGNSPLRLPERLTSQPQPTKARL
jgi:hypothetical protein